MDFQIFLLLALSDSISASMDKGINGGNVRIRRTGHALFFVAISVLVIADGEATVTVMDGDRIVAGGSAVIATSHRISIN